MSLSVTYPSLRREVARMLGYGRSFSEGTVAISTSTVTLTGGVWPADAAGKSITVSTGTFVVSSRNSDTGLTITGSTTVASGGVFDLHPWTGNQRQDIDDIIASGLRTFYAPPPLNGRHAHEWSFLRPTVLLTTTAPYTTGTVAITLGVVTLTGGTFPSWAADGEILVDGLTYSIASRDGNTQITLDDLTVTLSGSKTYSLTLPAQELPSDFAGFEGPLTYPPGVSSMYAPVKMIGEYQIRTMRQEGDLLSRPQYAAVRVKASTGIADQKWEILFWPVPDAEYDLTYRYRANPSRLTMAAPVPLGGQSHAETIVESCLAAAERKLDDGAGVHAQAFAALLAASVSQDMNHAPDALGYNGDRSDGVSACGDERFTDSMIVRYTGYTHGFDS